MIAGADGCKGGWVVAATEDWRCGAEQSIFVCGDFASLLAKTANCDVVVVDIPIGLATGCEVRECDLSARQALGANASSRVFRAPPLETLTAQSPEQFQSIHRHMTGRGAGYPVWGILPKLRDVNGLMTPALQLRVREFHPELAWMRIAGGHVLPSKHCADGLAARRQLLTPYVSNLHELEAQLNSKMSGVQVDDMLDALVGLMVARAIRDREVPEHRLPSETRQTDARGLRMEIWY